MCEDGALLKSKFLAVLRVSRHLLMRQQPLSPRRWEWRRRKEAQYCWRSASSHRPGLGLPGPGCPHTVPQLPPPVKLLHSELPSWFCGFVLYHFLFFSPRALQWLISLVNTRLWVQVHPLHCCCSFLVISRSILWLWVSLLFSRKILRDSKTIYCFLLIRKAPPYLGKGLGM